MNERISVLYVCPGGNQSAIADDVEREYPSLSVQLLSKTEDAFEAIDTDAVECLVFEHAITDTNDLAFLDRVSTAYPDLPCILFTDQGSEALTREALETGATDVISTSGSAPAVRLGNRIRQLVDARRTERELRQQQAHQRALRDAASDVIITIDEDSIITSVNAAVEEIFGYSREELIGNPLPILMSDDLAGQHRSGVERYLRTGERQLDWDSLELPGRHKDGQEVPLGVSFGEFTYQGERFFTGVLRDISESKQLEDKFRQERDLKDRIVNTSPVGIAVIDSDGEFSLVNRRAEEILGRPEEVLEEFSYDAGEFEIVDRNGEPIPESDLPFRVAMTANEPVFDRELGVSRPDGELVWLSANAAPIQPDGEATDVIVAFTDITERVELEAERDELFGRITDAFFSVDTDWNFSYLNERAEELINPEDRTLVGKSIWEEFSAAVDTTFEEQYRYAMANQEPVSFEEYFPPLECWFEVHAYPSETGLSVYFQDVTERKEREEELRESRERLELLIDNISEYAIFMLDPDGHIVTWNVGAERIKGYSEDEIGGEHLSTFYPEEDVDDDIPEQFIQRAREEGVAENEGWRVRKDGSRFWANAVLTALRDDEGELRGFAKVTRDMTERREYERTLEERERRYRTLVEHFPDGAVGLFDEDLRYTTFAGELLDQVGVDPDDRIGNSVLEVYPDDIVADLEPCYRDVFDGQTNVFEVEYHDRHLWAHTVPISDADGEISAGMVVIQDITERKEHEQALERQRERLAALNEVSQQLAEAETRQDVTDVVVEAAAATLDLPYSAVKLYDEDRGALQTASRTPAITDLLGDGPIFGAELDTPWQVFVTQERELLSDVSSRIESDEVDTPVRSAIIFSLGEYGVFISVSPDPDAFSEADIHLASILGANAVSALDRADREEDLRDQTETLAEQTRELERVNRVNGAIRGITQELVQTSTREEVAQAVCDRITTAESYCFAWIGSTDAATAEVTPEAWAGDGQGYLEQVPLSTDDDPSGREPAASVLATEDPQVRNSIHSDRPFDPWQQASMERGYQSCIAVPLVYKDRTYGVLALYAEATDVFNDLEAEVLEELGRTIGYALNALEQKQALVSDRSVELEFQGRNLSGSLLDFVNETDCEFEFENVVQRGDGLLHLFFTVRGVTSENVLQFGERNADIVDATCVSEGDSESLFEWTLAESSFLSNLLDRGAVLQTVEIGSDGGRIVVRVSASTEIRPFVELFEAEYQDVELAARREVDEPFMTQQEFDAEFRDVLTERQEEVLQTAYSAGFFESPRKSSAKDIANLLDVSQPTVSRHIRASERKLFSLYFE